jgi:hypothetical protein
MLKKIVAFAFIAAFSLSAQAAYVADGLILDGTLNAAGDDCLINPAACELSDINGGNDTSVWPFLGTLAYKAEYDPKSGDPGEEGTLAGSYSTTFFADDGTETATGGDPSFATIAYTGGNKVDCSADCWLVVKDGNNSPARYLFNLALLGWDGMQELDLQNFWNGTGGAISHVAIFGGVSEIPVPAAVWLFGTALIGFVGMSRKTKV